MSLLPTLSWEDMPSSWTPEWVVEGLIPYRGWSLCSGQPKSFKGMLRRYLTACMITGEPVFGQYPVVRRPSRILSLLAEDHPGAEHSFLETIIRSLGHEPEDLPVEVLYTRGLELKDARGKEMPITLNHPPFVRALRDHIREHDIDMLFIDPLANFHDWEEDNKGYRQLMKILLGLSSLCTVWVNHHTPKDLFDARGKEKDILGMSRGGGALNGAADALFGLKDRGGKVRTLLHTGKHDPTPGSIELEVDVGGSWMWRIPEELSEEHILDFLKHHGPAKLEVIARGVHTRDADVRKMLKTMVDNGLVLLDKGFMNTKMYSLP